MAQREGWERVAFRGDHRTYPRVTGRVLQGRRMNYCGSQGYRHFRCGECQRGFNERTGTPLNRLQYPTEVICLVVLWRLRYKLTQVAAYKQWIL
jgi:transposase-like protein